MKVLIWDDESEQVEANKQLLKKATNNQGIVCEFITCTTFDQVFFQMEEQGAFVDLILLGMLGDHQYTGIEAAQLLRTKYEYNREIIFVTREEKYAVDAYDVHAFHYILKDKTPTEKKLRILEEAIQRIKGKAQNHILLKGVGEFRNIAVDTIHYFETEGYMIVVHYGNGETFEFVSTMEKVANLVLNFGIIRIHRSYLVNVKQIESFSYYKGIVLSTGEVLPIGRKYMPELRELFGKDIIRKSKEEKQAECKA